MKNSARVIWMVFYFVLVDCFLGYAQKSPVTYGIRGGLHLATINQDFEDETVLVEGIPFTLDFNKKYYVTYGIGGFLEYRLNPMFALQLNALYSMKGVFVKTEFSTTVSDSILIDGTLEQTLKFGYFSFPLLAKLSFGNPTGIRPYLLAGPEIGILLTAEAKTKSKIQATVSNESYTFRDIQKENIKDECKSLEFSFNLGGGMEFPLGYMNGFIDARYGLGMSQVNEEGEEDLKNNVIYLNVGLKF